MSGELSVRWQIDNCNRITIDGFVTLILSVMFAFAADPIAEGADKFLGNIIQTSVPSNFADYWNQLTIENGAKWGEVEPSRDQMNWNTISIAYDYAQSTGYPYKHHTFVWGTQEPGWMSGLAADQQREEVEEWIKAYGERFPETEFIDVVNEPLNKPPSFKDALGGDGETGWDWVITSFEMAKEHCPDAQLLINEFEVEYDATLAAAYLEIIMLLKERDLVDGIGIQCHTNEIQRDKPTVEAINSALDTLASSGLPIYVSELDLKGDDAAQLADYQRLFPVFWEHSAVHGVTLWGYQGDIWNTEAVLIKNGIERPALQWLRSYIDSMKIATKTSNADRPKTVHDFKIRISTDNTLTVTLFSPENVNIRITDLRGRVLFRCSSQSSLINFNQVSIPTAGFASGMYLFTVQRKTGTQLRRVVIP